MDRILYTFGGALYVNLTNRCPCRCSFCIRFRQEGVGSASSLWLEKEPTAAEVAAGLSHHDLSAYGEVVFCGYGEPFCALDVMLEVCGHLRKTQGVGIRVNTNGLGDLINGKRTAPLLAGLVDTVSVSLNASNAELYSELCGPSFGPESYGAMLRFAEDCKRYVPRVWLSVVDVVPRSEIEACRRVAGRLGLPLRVRHAD